MPKLRRIRKIVASAILIEGVIAGFSVYQEFTEPKKEHSFRDNYFLKNSRFSIGCGEEFLERPLQTIAGAIHLTPLFLRYYLGINQSIDEKLQEAVQNEKTLHGIEQLFTKDDMIGYAEIGGMAFLARDENNSYYLNFCDIQCENETESLELMREQDNPEKILHYFKERGIHKKTQMADYIDNLLKRIDAADKKTRSGLIKTLIEMYKFSSDYLYTPSYTNVAGYLYQNFTSLNGKLIGSFHTHNMAEPPSDADLAGSRYARQFVLVRNPGSYEIYDIYKREINKKYAIPIEKPQKLQK